LDNGAGVTGGSCADSLAGLTAKIETSSKPKNLSDIDVRLGMVVGAV
jgi:hypothetical protein